MSGWYALRWLALLFPSVAAPIVLDEAQIGLAGNLAVNAVSLAIQLVGSFWCAKRLRLIREATPENGHGAEHIR